MADISGNNAEVYDLEPRGKKRQTSDSRQKSSNESITLRLHSLALAKLRKEAGEKDLTINTLVNQIIRNHVEWHSIAANAGFISVRRGLIKKLLDHLGDDEIRSTADYIARTTNRDFLMFFRKKVSVECALDYIESWVRVSGFAYRHETSNDFKHSFVIQHDMGRKWSLYLGELFRHLFNECKAMHFNYDGRDNTLSFEVK